MHSYAHHRMAPASNRHEAKFITSSKEIIMGTLSGRGRWYAWAALSLVTIATFAVVFIPVWLIQPFRAETWRGLETSYLLRRWSPWVTPLTAAVVIWLAARLWRGTRWWSKPALVLPCIVALTAAWF